MSNASRLIGIVGPCSSGKSTTAEGLREAGYRIKEIRQEHCAMPSMWQRLTHPDILIYLDVSMAEAARREGLDKSSSWWIEEREVRLAHARQHCDLYIDTTHLSPKEVLDRILSYLEDRTFPFLLEGDR